MADKTVYLEFLESYKLKESDVSPVVAVNRKEKADGLIEELLSDLATTDRKTLSPYANELLSALLDGLDYFDSNTNKLVEKMHSEFLQELVKIKIKVDLKNVYAGVFPTNSFNAHAVKKAGQYLILLDNGLFEVLESVIAIMLSGRSLSYRASKLAGVIQDYSLRHKIPDPYEFEEYENISRYQVGVAMVNYVEMFVIAHEYGHIIRGHFKTNEQIPLHSLQGTVPVLKKSVIQEYEADLWALSVVEQASRKTADNELVQLSWMAGPLVFFGTASLIEKLKSKETGLEVDLTHPPASERLIRSFLYFGMKDRLDLDYGRRYLELVNECSHLLFGEGMGINFTSLSKVSRNIPYMLPRAVGNYFSESSKVDLEFELMDALILEATKQGKINPAFYTAHSTQSTIDWGFEFWGYSSEEEELMDVFKTVVKNLNLEEKI